jgi:hypothetical protein
MKVIAAALGSIALFGAVTISLAADSTDPLSGLPLPPNSQKLTDPVESYKYCGKSAQSHGYMYSGGGNDDEDLVATAKAWYAKALPHANVLTSPTGQVTLVTADGTAAVILSGAIISFVRFSPGLSAAEMKGFGNVPASKECQSAG